MKSPLETYIKRENRIIKIRKICYSPILTIYFHQRNDRDIGICLKVIQISRFMLLISNVEAVEKNISRYFPTPSFIEKIRYFFSLEIIRITLNDFEKPNIIKTRKLIDASVKFSRKM
jgi:hypothetical protein